MANDEQRITIGFRGQPLPVRAAAARVTDLLDALRSGRGGWHELETEDGSLVLDLEKVEWVRIDAQEQRVGFGL